MNLPSAPEPAATPSQDGAAKPAYVLKLFISGQTSRSTLALKNLRKICDANLSGKYELEVVDIYQDPRRAAQAQIVAAPTLLKVSPEPLRRIIGDLSDTAKVLAALGLAPRGAAYTS